jgi:hypothetical protein
MPTIQEIMRSYKGENMYDGPVDIGVPPEQAQHRSVSERKGRAKMHVLQCLVDLAKSEPDVEWFSIGEVTQRFRETWPWLNKFDLEPSEISGSDIIDKTVNNILNAHADSGKSLESQGNTERRQSEKYAAVFVRATETGKRLVNSLFDPLVTLRDAGSGEILKSQGNRARSKMR